MYKGFDKENINKVKEYLKNVQTFERENVDI